MGLTKTNNGISVNSLRRNSWEQASVSEDLHGAYSTFIDGDAPDAALPPNFDGPEQIATVIFQFTSAIGLQEVRTKVFRQRHPWPQHAHMLCVGVGGPRHTHLRKSSSLSSYPVNMPRVHAEPNNVSLSIKMETRKGWRAALKDARGSFVMRTLISVSTKYRARHIAAGDLSDCGLLRGALMSKTR